MHKLSSNLNTIRHLYISFIMSTDHDAGNSVTWDESIAKYIDQSWTGGISAITGSSNFNIRHGYAYIRAKIVKVKGQLSKIWEVGCDSSAFRKGISCSVEQTLVGEE